MFNWLQRGKLERDRLDREKERIVAEGLRWTPEKSAIFTFAATYAPMDRSDIKDNAWTATFHLDVFNANPLRIEVLEIELNCTLREATGVRIPTPSNEPIVCSQWTTKCPGTYVASGETKRWEVRTSLPKWPAERLPRDSPAAVAIGITGSAMIVGGVWNFYPAKVYVGDTGPKEDECTAHGRLPVVLWLPLYSEARNEAVP